MAFDTKNVLATPTVMIDNIAYDIVPNSFKYTEGFGEQIVRTQSSGGGQVSTVVARNVETSKSKVSFSLEPTQVNIENIRTVKASLDRHVITAFDNRIGFTRTFQQAVLINDYEVNLGSDTSIDLEFEGAPAI